MKKLYLDDVRTPTSSDFAIVRSYDDAVCYLKANGCPNVVSFDHDLGDVEDNTGFDLAKWMVERDMDMDGKFIPINFTFTVHSMNPVGSQNISGLLNGYIKHRNNPEI